ncbi:Hpt domain-containing protein [Hymenobacter rigui]|uniref:Hpt domain-containing protein n=1 Tax=Hymenobacter rigui TaxID=334424 RepID=A0A428K9M9_9BACT|nr:Hpt domain-containing protein [Hymenobacter rigui]RSK43078.1 Hpt domain-containing protein [Hymenobacter rigui]
MSSSHPAEPACTNHTPLYNLSALGRLAHDAGFVREFKQLVLQEMPERLADLEAAVTAANWTRVVRESHSLKSTMGQLGLPEPAHLLRQMELAAASQPVRAQLRGWLRRLRLAVAPVLLAFQQELRADRFAPVIR